MLCPACVVIYNSVVIADEPTRLTNKKLLPSSQLELQRIHFQYDLQGQGTEIAVLDTGILLTHEVFSSKGGKVSGCNFFEQVGDDPTKDKQWQTPSIHGTAVSAIAAGNQYCEQNESGNVERFGIAPKAKLYICRVSNGKSYPWNCVIQALNHLICLKKKDPKRIDIAVMSFGSKQKNSEVENLLDQLADLGVILVAAGGNEGARQDDIFFPSSDKNVISVGAFDPDGRVAGFAADYAHIYAQGEDIYVPSVRCRSTS